MHSTETIGQRDNSVEGLLHGFGDTFRFGDWSHPDVLWWLRSIGMVACYGSCLQQYSAEIDGGTGVYALVTVLGMGNGVSTLWAENAKTMTFLKKSWMYASF